MKTLCDIFFYSVDTYRKSAHLRVKRDGRWCDISSAEYLQAVEEVSLGLRELGVDKGDRVAILSENRPEWAFADLATLCAAAIDVPIYPTLSPAQIVYLLKDCGAKAIFVSNPDQAAKIATIRAQAPALAHVILMDEAPVPGTVTLAELRRQGREVLTRQPSSVRDRAREVQAADVATIIYTSGTTGEPKGVMLTHDNLVSNVDASADVVEDMGLHDSCLSFLPLCHVFERLAGHYLMLKHGSTIAYAESVDRVPANLLEVQPTVLVSVPRLYEKIHMRIQEKVASDPPRRRKIFHWALATARAALPHRLRGTTPPGLAGLKLRIADALVFSKIRARTGGRLRLLVSGGAALPPEVASFFAAVGLPIQEGYGLTETSPVIAANRPRRVRIGTVGQALPGVEVKIAEDGEILARGRLIMKGYYRKPEATAEAIDAEGWFHTGDIGRLDAEGYLSITDRKKDIIVTSGGKKIAPQPIESLLKTNPFVAEIVLVGNGRHFPAALVVPSFERLEVWARERSIAFTRREDLVGHPVVVAHYAQQFAEMTPHLAQFEKIKKVALLHKEFTLESGELTPTLKVKRKVIEERYQKTIDGLYEGT